MLCCLPNDRRLTNTETTDEATSIDGSKVSVDTADHEDDNTESPDGAEDSSSPDTSNTITNEESTGPCQ